MAKSVATSSDRTLATVVPHASVAWFRSLNYARPSGDYGDEKESKEILDALVEHDWWLGQGEGFVIVEGITPELRDQALKERAAQLAKLEEEAKTIGDAALELKVFKELYCDEKGKLIPPRYTAVTANRRGALILRAKVLRRKANKPIHAELPVVEMKFDSPMHRLEVQMLENTGKTLGNKEPSPRDLLMVARRVLEYAGTEADLTRALGNKRGMAQKLWGIVLLNTRFPKLDIVNRMILPATEGRSLPWGVDKEDLRKLVLRSDPKKLDLENNKLAVGGQPPMKAATEEEVGTYFEKPKENGGNTAKIMARQNIEGLADNNPNHAVRLLGKAIITNNTDVIRPLNVFAPAFNALLEMVEAGDGPGVEAVLVRLARAKPDLRTVLVDELKRALDKHGA